MGLNLFKKKKKGKIEPLNKQPKLKSLVGEDNSNELMPPEPPKVGVGEMGLAIPKPPSANPLKMPASSPLAVSHK